jgi:hypothetical protein
MAIVILVTGFAGGYVVTSGLYHALAWAAAALTRPRSRARPGPGPGTERVARDDVDRHTDDHRRFDGKVHDNMTQNEES